MSRMLRCSPAALVIRPWLRLNGTGFFTIVATKRFVTTLQDNPHIYVFPDLRVPGAHILSLLPSEPPRPELAIGSTTKLPPTTESLSENPKFLSILQEVLAKYASEDEGVISQAKAFASTSGSGLGSGGSLFPNQRRSKRTGHGGRGGTGGDGAGGASSQGGAGGGGMSGFVHVSDSRNPPDFGRIAWPEDIFGSVQVDEQGNLVGDAGSYQPSGTYRILTREGMLGLTPFLRGKVIERLRELA